MIRHSSSGPPREGIVLVLVVSLLALFAVVGLSFVIYSESAATQSRTTRDAQVVVDDSAQIEPELILNRILGALIYDHPDDQTGVYSALRGHSLARSMYGWNDPVNTNGNNTNVVPFNGIGRLRDPGFETRTLTFPGGRQLSGLPWDQIINYTYQNRADKRDPILRDPERYPYIKPGNSQLQTTDFRTDLNATTIPTAYFGGYNAPYTYPDLNNVFLGAIRAFDGQVLIPSFHRPYLFGALDPATNANWYKDSGRLKLLRPRPFDQLTKTQLTAIGINGPIPEGLPAATEQTLAGQYYQKLLPLINQGKLLPFPTDVGGDVKNLLGSPGGNDSVWLDIGLPVRLTKSGKKFKPLVAMLIVDLDGRVNLNVHGNLHGVDPVSGNRVHSSNQGFGRHEVNASKIFANTNEYTRLFSGDNSTSISGRFGIGSTTPQYLSPSPTTASSYLNPGFQPGSANSPIVYTIPTWGGAQVAWYEPPYFRVDLDGSKEEENYASSDMGRAWVYQRPPPMPNPPPSGYPMTLSSFPDFYTPISGTTTGYGNESPLAAAGQPNERENHPFLYNPLRATGNSRSKDAIETHKLIARFNSPLDYGDSLLSKLLPTTLATAKNRHLITLLSADVGRPGISPQSFNTDLMNPPTTPPSWGQWAGPNWFPFSKDGENFQTYNDVLTLYSSITNYVPFPNDYFGNLQYAFYPAPRPPSTSPAAGTIRQTLSTTPDGRNTIASKFGRLDMNRPLRPYPQPTETATGRFFNTSDPITGGLVLQQIQAAEQDRQDFAEDIFKRLQAAVGVAMPDTTPPNPPFNKNDPRHAGLKYLAQLAVNIVDYIDEDDIMTRFVWNPSDNSDPVVYGVEMPKVVINEVYAEQTNGPSGNQEYVAPQPPSASSTAKKYQINVWVELHNLMVPPFRNTGNPADPETQKYELFKQRHKVWLANTGASGKYSVYKLHLIKDPGPTAITQTIGPPRAGSDPSDEQPPAGVARTLDFATDPGASSAPGDFLPVDTSIANGACGYRCNPSPMGKNVGFYVIGPDQPMPLQTATPAPADLDATIKSSFMRYNVMATATTDTNVTPPVVLLQRLANPYFKESPTNQYVTVDVMRFTKDDATLPDNMQFNQQNLVVNQAIQYTSSGAGGGGGGATRRSVVRRQPLAGNYMMLARHPDITPPSDPHQSLFKHNASTGDNPPSQLPEIDPMSGNPVQNGLDRFEWLVHLDRRLVSPMELLHVSAVAPWEVTKKFMYKTQLGAPGVGDPMLPPAGDVIIRHGHTAPWLDDLETFDLNTRKALANVKLSRVQSIAGVLPPPPPGTASALPSSRLYRALEFFRVGDRTVEMAFGGRELGKININTVFDKEVFDAICDAKLGTTSGNIPEWQFGFTKFDVKAIWNAMNSNAVGGAAARTPSYYSSSGSYDNDVFMAGTYTQITANDRPFWGLGAPHEALGMQNPPVNVSGQNVNLSGVQMTLLRSMPAPTGPGSPKRTRLFDAESQFNVDATATVEPPVRHGMMEKALLSKIFEHLTTRSNVFAVYMTVGYFEVTDDTQKPELLGDEIGIIRDSNSTSTTFGQIIENKAIRHRMFSIIDRTNLSLSPPVYDFVNGQMVPEDSRKQGMAPFYYTVTPELTPSGPSTGPPYNPGLWLVRIPYDSFGPYDGAPSAGKFKWLQGTYNGMSWMITAKITNRISTDPMTATVLYFGEGTEKRQLVVKSIRRDSANANLAILELGVPPATGTPNNWPGLDPTGIPGQFNPPELEPGLLTNVIAGNPGPQPDFDHRLPNYRGVVLYSVIMD